MKTRLSMIALFLIAATYTLDRWRPGHWGTRASVPTVNEASIPLVTTLEQSLPKPSAQPPLPQSAPSAPTEQAMPVPPTSAEVRHDDKDDKKDSPTASSLMHFASDLDARMEVAERSETEANKLFTELEDCVMDDSQDLPVQTVCLINAQLLNEKFEVFNSRTLDLRAKADPEVVRLAD